MPELRVQENAERGPIRLKERFVRYMAGFGTGVDYGVHANNLKNLTRGIVERVLYVRRGEGLGKPPQPKNGVFSRLASIRARLVANTPPTPVVGLDDYPELYSGRKRAIYQRAVDSLKARWLTVKDAFVDTFLKAEKINFDSKGDPAPRVIQPRSPRYNVGVGRYLKLFEKQLLHRGFRRVFGYDVVMKGLNAQEVGAALASNWYESGFKEPAAVGLDASRFDQHVSVDALKWEHSVYNSVFRSPELRKLLSWQLCNTGIARVDGKKVTYKVNGCRMSGDINTGLGNCLLMSSIVIAYCEANRIKHRLANNGDDCVLFVEKSDISRLAGIDAWFLDFGFKLTREAPVFVLEEVEFCQSHPVLCANGWRMVRDPRTAMSKDCVSLIGWDTEDEIKSWAHAIGTCGSALTSGVPVWHAWYQRLVAMGNGASEGVMERVYDCGMGFMAQGVSGCEIDAISRHSFWRAFGILPDMQEALEAEYSAPVNITAITPTVYRDYLPIDTQNPLTIWLANKTA